MKVRHHFRRKSLSGSNKKQAWQNPMDQASLLLVKDFLL
jgi:hypothetical protein